MPDLTDRFRYKRKFRFFSDTSDELPQSARSRRSISALRKGAFSFFLRSSLDHALPVLRSQGQSVQKEIL